MAPFGKGGHWGIFASIFMRSVAVTNCIFIRDAKAAKAAMAGDYR
jgi:hypothetical protein